MLDYDGATWVGAGSGERAELDRGGTSSCRLAVPTVESQPAAGRHQEKMTAIQDLEPCDYFPVGRLECLVSVGWLRAGEDFPKGEVDRDFFRRLCQLIQNPWEPIASAGFHHCELCRFTEGGSARFEDMLVPATSGANLFVPYDGKLYVAPVLIAHYIDAHGYRPPAVFSDAIMACPPMRSREYRDAFLANGGRDFMKGLTAERTDEPDDHSAGTS